MSTSTFPALLRRSAFASYDPAITRIYTSAQPSTPSSSSTSSPRSSEYGLKYAVNAKRARYIKVKALDAGVGLGCDWESGEKEARFVQRWGDGSVRWNGRDEERTQILTRAKLTDTEEKKVEEEKTTPDMLPDVEGMSAKAFDRYLEGLRAKRSEFAGKVKPESGVDSSFSLLRHARSNDTSLGEVSRYQSELAGHELADEQSDLLNGTRHATHGLTYSNPPRSIGTIPGRVLNQETRHAQRQNKADGVRGIFNNTNANWVVGLGGLTASMSNEMSMGDISMDYTREDKTVGTGEFVVELASALRPPKVVNLDQPSIRRSLDVRPISKAKRAQPLDNFTFKLNVKPAPVNSPVAFAGKEAEPALGSPEWVAKERKAPGPAGGYLARTGASVNLGRAAGGTSRTQSPAQAKFDISALLQNLARAKGDSQQ